jgi:hypothetical protein
MRNRLAFLFGIVAVLGTPSAAFAHAMLVKVEVTATEIRVAVSYDGADHGGEGPTVTLFRMPGKVPVEKTPTDKLGLAVFAKPPTGKYLVVAEDEFHGVEKLIDVSEDATTYADEPVNKWLMIALGLAAIGGLTLAGWYFSKPKKA